jgi:hypothetical protein
MSFDPTWLFVSLVAGAIGLGLFGYGKKQGRMPHIAAGLALMVYPYFATTLRSLLVLGVAICVALWGMLRIGW